VPNVEIVSRAEPWPRVTLARRSNPTQLHPHWTLVSPEPFVLPVGTARDRRRWWPQAVRWQPPCDPDQPMLAWDPFALATAVDGRRAGRVVLDLLDDWTIHPAFAGIGAEVHVAYERAFSVADLVVANSEGTGLLARRFGRDDVLVIPNGVDPERFSLPSTAAGPRILIGYAGKIGRRLDLPLIQDVSRRLAACRFVFAGPVLDRSVRRALARLPNVDLVGDVHYASYPALLGSWDIGWVPHLVGRGEVGGDVIKTYEYRAAGLPTVSTPVIGSGRLAGVAVASRDDVLAVIETFLPGTQGARVPRQPMLMPAEHTWADKARRLARLLFDDVPSCTSMVRGTPAGTPER
jgi:glycosyltransferase involved in cell wall biosynthesis